METREMTDEAQARVKAWDRAARRALAADLPHQLRVKGGTVLVPSKTQEGITYHVALLAGERVGQCDCPAGLSGKPCAHRVAVAIRVWERRMGLKITALKPAAIVRLAAMLS